MPLTYLYPQINTIIMTEELEKQLKQLFNDEQQLRVNEQGRFHNSEEGKTQYELVSQELQPCKGEETDETIKEITPKHLKYSLAMADVCISEEVADLTLRILKRLQELGGNFSLKDAYEIRAKWDEDCRVTNERLAQKQPTKQEDYDNGRN